MNRKALSAFVLGALLAFAAQAQAQVSQKPAAEPAPAAAAPGPGQEPDPKIIEGIMQCLGEGLPEGWQKTWFVISETGRSVGGSARQFEAKFFYATDPKDAKGKPLSPCGGTRIVDHVISLNDYLQPSQRRWTGMTMTFMIDGTYSANYDYTRKPAATPAKPAARPAAKKKQETKQ